MHTSNVRRSLKLGECDSISNLEGKKTLAERGFDPRTSGLWAQHASTAPLCYSYKSNRQRSTSSSSSSSSETEKADRLSRQFPSTIRSSVVMTPLVSFL